MLDFATSSASTDGAHGLLAAANTRPSPSRAASRNDAGEDNFADQLDASLARAEDESDCAECSDDAAPAPHGDDDRVASESAEPSPSRHHDDEEEQAAMVPSPDAAAMAAQLDELANQTAAAIWPIAIDLTTPAGASDVEEVASETSEIADAMSNDEAASFDPFAESPEDAGVQMTVEAAASTHGTQQRHVDHDTRRGNDTRPVEDPSTAFDSAPDAAPTEDAPALPFSAAPDIAEPPAVAETKNVASIAGAETDTRATATTSIAEDSMFDQFANDAGESSPEDNAQPATQGASLDRSGTPDTTKPAATPDFEAHVLNASESRGAVVAGHTPITSARIAEFESAARALETASFTHAPAADTSDRIVQSLRMQFARGGGDAIVHIKPEHLGPLSISLRVENGSVSARIIADNPVVAEWIQANEQTLRDGLKSNGLQLDRLVITRDDDPSSRTPHRESPESRRGTQRRFDARQSTFEITV